MEEPEMVFVYGTLRRGGSDAFRMAGAEFVSAGTIVGRLYRVDWYPGLVLDEAGDEIAGEVYAVPPRVLAALDAFEGLPAGDMEGSQYRRVRTGVVLQDSRTLDAWVWEWLGPVTETRRISGGNWLQPQ